MPRHVPLALLALLALPGAAAAQAPPPGGDTAPVDSRAPDPVPPTPELARLLARWDGEADPARALKRAFASTVHFLLARDVERLLPHFHPELRFHVGGGDFDAMPPDALRQLFTERLAVEGPDAPRRKLEDVVDLATVKVYSKARARDADRLKDGWATIDPRHVARLMGDDDWLVMAKLKDEDDGPETFYVFRKDGARWKVIIAE